MATDYATIVVRRGNADAWENSQRPLASGEWGYDETGRVVKIGDGFSLWSDLGLQLQAGSDGQLPAVVRNALGINMQEPGTPEGDALRAVRLATSTVVNARDFGAAGDGAADDTDALAAAIAAASATGAAATVFLPKGEYVVRSLEMVKGVSLRGAGRDKTTLFARAGDTSPALITFAAGYVDHVFIEDLTLVGGGANNPNQTGVYAYARTADGSAGSSGWASGGMRRVTVRNFRRDALRLRGGGGGTRDTWQHQFLVFDQVELIAERDSAAGTAARVTGKAGQVTWINCQFSTSAGTPANLGTNLVVGREVDDSGNVLSTASSYAHTFLNCSVEGRDRGVRIEGGFSIVFVGTFMEALGSALKASDDARGVSMIGTHFASAGHNQAGNGSLVEGSGTSVVSLLGGTVTGAADRSFVDAVTAHGVAMDPTISSASNTGQFGINSGEIVTRQYATALVNGPGTLSKITSALSVGEALYVKAYGGPLTVTDAANIRLGGRVAPVMVPQDAIATFVRFDLSGEWHLAALSKE